MYQPISDKDQLVGYYISKGYNLKQANRKANEDLSKSNYSFDLRWIVLLVIVIAFVLSGI